MNRSESRAAMWAARPTRALAVLGNACCTSYLTTDTVDTLAANGDTMLCTYKQTFYYIFIRATMISVFRALPRYSARYFFHHY